MGHMIPVYGKTRYTVFAHVHPITVEFKATRRREIILAENVEVAIDRFRTRYLPIDYPTIISKIVVRETRFYDWWFY